MRVAVRRLMMSATVLTIAAATMGSYVRGNGAGLACPDWPLCYGQVVPTFDWWIFLEWFHRMLVGIVSLLIGAATALAWWKRMPELRLAIATSSLLLVQAVMGGLTVILLTDPIIVAIHQGMAFVFFAFTCWLTARLHQPETSVPTRALEWPEASVRVGVASPLPTGRTDRGA